MVEIWGRQQNESSKAHHAFLIYRDLGVNRSIDSAYRVNLKEPQNTTIIAPRGWGRWSTKYQWVRRAQAWDAHQQSERDRIAREAEEAEIRRVMSLRYAKTHYRVEDLNEVASRLFEEMKEDDKVWLPDVKQIGGGEFAERVDITRFNAPIFEKYYDALNAIALELGERQKKNDTADLESSKGWAELAERVRKRISGE